MIREQFNFRFNELNIRVEDIERILGRESDENRQLVLEMISEVLDEAAVICDVKAEYVIWDGAAFDHENKTMTIDGITYGIGKIILGQLKKTESVAVFLCGWERQ
ncbi:MAG: hypothetical protein MZV64_05320 [Ignavibacteriales bacterium]|nr:hypothetical protein [Ignavibacteriales bacterium]